jgi:hypothetical protein
MCGRGTSDSDDENPTNPIPRAPSLRVRYIVIVGYGIVSNLIAGVIQNLHN